MPTEKEVEESSVLQRDAAALACMEAFQVSRCCQRLTLIWCMLTGERQAAISCRVMRRSHDHDPCWKHSALS